MGAINQIYDLLKKGLPIDDNATPEGKANNRRVEFVKTKQAIRSVALG